MPIYEYVCESCGETTEALQKMSDPPLTDCPSGHGGKLVKVLSAHNVGGASGKGGGSAMDFGGGCGAQACGFNPGTGMCGGGACGEA
jgi:putative FmdB family regulatory protein